jgi:hypothetical protein
MYHHSQTASPLMILLFLFCCAGMLFMYIGIQSGFIPSESESERTAGMIGSGVGLLVMLLLALSMYGLTVEEELESIRLRYGIGLISKRIPFSRIKSCEVVRNPWYYGWGIRKIPKGWMWNISGLDAVELIYQNDKRFRIGTDEAEMLSQVINNHISYRP